jgi:signal peptidase II
MCPGRRDVACYPELVSSTDSALRGPGVGRRVVARRRDIYFFLVAGAVIALDQLTKWLVRSNLGLYESWPSDAGFIRIVHVVNSGAAFGILQGQTPFLIVTSMLGLAAILLYYIYPPMDHGIIRIALGMQLGGAIGNLIDRVRFGEVTDFIHVGSFPTFNVADSSITISIITVLLFFTFLDPNAAPSAPASPPAPSADAANNASGDE